MEVQVLARKIIKPSKPTPLHLQHLKLSLFDQLAPPMYVAVLLYYSPMREETAAKSTEKLEKSLSETLTNFYPLAGRMYAYDDLWIACNDQGVEFIEAQVEKDLAEFLHEGPKIELLKHFFAWDFPTRTYPESIPLLAIQVNRFSCGGLVLGIQISHKIADAYTLAKFINEWAYVCRSPVPVSCTSTSFGDLANLFPARILSASKLPPASTCKGKKIVTRRFLFDAPSIANLRERVLSRDTTIQPTRIAAVIAVVWKAIVGVTLAKNGNVKDSFLLSPAINLRGRAVLTTLSQKTLGNFWLCGLALFQANKHGTELHDFVKLMMDAIRGTTINLTEASIDDISSLLINNYKEVAGRFVMNDECKTDAFLFTSWCKFSWYEADFGWGKPIWVSSEAKDFEVIALLDTRNGDGIEVWVSLKEEDMIQFEQDQDIIFFTSKVTSLTGY